MTQKQLENLKQMLDSQNDDDKNLAGQLIVNNLDDSTLEILQHLLDKFSSNQIDKILKCKFEKLNLDSWRMEFFDFGTNNYIRDNNRCGELILKLDD